MEDKIAEEAVVLDEIDVLLQVTLLNECETVTLTRVAADARQSHAEAHDV